jgi:uncharacterized protein YndB with AHSA1/START domain
VINDNGDVVHDARFAHPIDRVWNALVDPNALGEWLMPTTFEPRVGHRFTFDAGPPRGPIHAEVLSLDPPHRIEMRWILDDAPTIVTITLRADGNATDLHLEHTNLLPDLRPKFDDGWVDKFRDLTDLLQGAS